MEMEYLRDFLKETGLDPEVVEQIMDRVVQIRSDAYGEGWDDGRAESRD